MLSLDQTARISDRSPEVIRRWLRAGILQGEKSSSGYWLIPLNQIALIQRRVRYRHVAV